MQIWQDYTKIYSKYIDKRYKEYLRSSFEFGKTKLQQLFIEQLNKEKLFKGPYVDMSFPFQNYY